ncbi:MAG: hypothetical protein AABX63_05510 [Nanoarchaeota archaeon]
MEITFLSYFLASITAYLGLLVGTILIRMAPEEQKPGRKYFILLEKILFLAILALPLYYFKINIILSLVLLSFVAALMLGNKIKLNKSYLVYFLFGFFFYLGSRFIDLFVIEAVLIFLYGIPNASLSLSLKNKNYNDVLIKNLTFFVPIAILYLVF